MLPCDAGPERAGTLARPGAEQAISTNDTIRMTTPVPAAIHVVFSREVNLLRR